MVGVAVYAAMVLMPDVPQRAGILVALPASAAAMWLAGILGKTETPTMIEAVERLHSDI